MDSRLNNFVNFGICFGVVATNLGKQNEARRNFMQNAPIIVPRSMFFDCFVKDGDFDISWIFHSYPLAKGQWPKLIYFQRPPTSHCNDLCVLFCILCLLPSSHSQLPADS